eukprot:CAMPEP_0185027820 /NCGR_PEP_ID=MMETSP1103-20130426/13065_1 /TAXON_ID=36769 /ORGANISM="Paraphysomonas bandaiensis, Strain Caron Lab Isolate" /LENGTH=287 /DNA_ID=CAMNT_0027561959 /DNA_START=44 /DNA_END=904 /DNA_ORIENTATION=+
MALEVFREPLYRRYYAQSSSAACLYTIFYAFILIFLPLFIAYSSSSFWIKESTVYEQPDFQYNYNALFQFHGFSSDGSPLNLFWSSSTAINDLYSRSDLLRSSILTSAELDDNRDGLTDRVEIGVRLPLAVGEKITRLDALIFADVRVQEKAKVSFDGAVYITHSSGTAAMGSLEIDGDVVIRQRWPMRAKGGFRSPYDKEPLLPTIYEYTSASEVSFPAVLRKSAARNLSLSFEPNFSYFSAPINPDDPTYASAAASVFNTTLTLRIPSQHILYTPTVSEVLKFAW